MVATTIGVTSNLAGLQGAMLWLLEGDCDLEEGLCIKPPQLLSCCNLIHLQCLSGHPKLFTSNCQAHLAQASSSGPTQPIIRLSAYFGIWHG